MLYIAEIELVNFIQLSGKTYHKFYNPYDVHVFVGPNGSGKSSILNEHDPRPTVHGFTTILKDKEGMKRIIFRDTEDRSFGLKVVHYYKPKKNIDPEKEKLKPELSKHTISSFLYEMHYDDVVKTIVNGQTSQFREVFPKYFELTYDSISITTIGLKLGKNIFNLMSCNDTERYNYLKMVLRTIDEARQLEDTINNKSQIINRRLKDYKTIISSISETDFRHEIEKLELDIRDFSKQHDIHQENKVRLGIEYDKVSSVSIADRDAYIDEYKELNNLYDIVGDESYIDEYNTMHNDYIVLNARINSVDKSMSTINVQLSELEKTNPKDKNFEMKSIIEDITYIKEEMREYNDELVDLSVIDDAQRKLNSIQTLIEKITMYPDIIFEDVDEFDNSRQIRDKIDKLSNKLVSTRVQKSDLMNESIPDHEKNTFHRATISYDKNCEGCSLYKKYKDVSDKISIIEANNTMIQKLDKDIDDIRLDLDKLERIMSLFSYVVELREIADTLRESALADIVNNSDIKYIFNNMSDIEDHLKHMKYNALNSFKLRDLEAKLQTLKLDDSMDKIVRLNEELSSLQIDRSEVYSEWNKIKNNRLFIISKEVAYKYASIDRGSRLRELKAIIHEISEIKDKTSSINMELEDLSKAMITLTSLIERKRAELTKIQIEQARFEENTTNYKNELARSEQANLLKTVLSKKIPIIFLDLYMIYVMEEANAFLADIDRYKIAQPRILYDEDSKRNIFVIPIIDNGEMKSCSVLSKGEDNIMSVAITLPLMYVASKNYRILRLDEMDSTLDVSMKKLFMDKIFNLDPHNVSQVFMVSHTPKDVFENNFRCKIIDLGVI